MNKVEQILVTITGALFVLGIAVFCEQMMFGPEPAWSTPFGHCVKETHNAQACADAIKAGAR